MDLLKKERRDCIKLYKDVFTYEECSELIGLLMCKMGIEWGVHTNQLEQTRSMVYFGRRRVKGMYNDPYPVSKHMDIFSIVNTKVKDILEELERKGLIEFNNRIIDQWMCYLYENGENCSPEIDLTFTPNMPIVIIVLGKSRYIIIRSKKNGRSILRKRVRNGSMICLFENFGKYYTYQIPIVDCSNLHIQMNGSFTHFT
jgi:hypothetical protein